MNTILVAGLLALQGGGPAAEPPQRPFTLNFSDTDVSQIFRVIGLRTGTNIIYSGAEKIPVSISYTANTTEEAVRSVATAAGLAYRRVGVKTYVAAKPDAIKRALAPFARRARLASPGLADAEAYFAKTLPDLTILSATTRSIEVLGIQADIDAAQETLDRLSKDQEVARDNEAKRGPVVTDVVTLSLADVVGMTAVLQQLYPDVRVISLGGATSTLSAPTAAAGGAAGATPPAGGTGTGVGTGQDPNASPPPQIVTGRGGVITLIGRREDVNQAKAKAKELDAAVSSLTSDIVVVPYEIRFAAPRAIIALLAQVAPEIQASIGPQAFSPPPFGLSVGASSSPTQSGGGASGLTNDPNDLGQRVSQEVVQREGGRTSLDIGGAADRSKRIILKGRATDVAAAIAILRKIDVTPPQVVVDIRVVDTSPEFLSNVGIDFSYGTLQIREGSPNTAITPLNSPVGLNSFGLGSVSRSALAIDALLSARQQTSDVKILARPSIQVMDNEEANFFVGDTVSYPAPTSSISGTTVQVLTFQVGIGVRVRPRVNADGQVTMLLNPFVSTITGILNGLPQTSTREATTTVMVRDGETVVLGGLIRDEDRKTITEVPLLSRIPVIGQLFRNTLVNKRRSNIIVTITPRVVRNEVQ